MATVNSVSSPMEGPKRNPFFFILSLLVLLGAVAAALYLHFQKSTINEEQNRLDNEIQTLNQEVSAFEIDKIEAAQTAQKSLESLQKEEIRWSDVLEKMNTLLPEDAQGNDTITFLSFSGSQGGKLTVNAQTRPAKVEPFADVSALIKSFNTSSFFANAYIPTISRGENDVGDKILTFVFNLTYKEKLPEEIQNSVQVTSESPDLAPTKIPRQ